MAAQQAMFSRAWRILSAARTALGAGCVASQFAARKGELSEIAVLAIAFLVFSVLVLVWKRAQEAGIALLGLCIDAVFLLIFASFGADPGFWLSSAFYLYLILSAIVLHGWGEVFIVSGACIVFFGLVQRPGSEALTRLVLFSGLLACILAIQRRRVEQLLEDAMRREEMHRIEAEKARAAERQRIAGDFHDGPLQNFISFQVRLDILRRLLDRDRAAALEELKQLQDTAKNQVAELRSFLRTMRPQEVEGSDLVAYIRRITEDFQKDTGIPVRFASSDASITAPPETSQEILQIVREALKNVQKHSRAGRVSVSLEKTGKSLEIAVDDNGAGFGFSGLFTLEELELLRLGPQSIKRRVRSLGGELVVESRPGQGAGLRIRIPA